MKSHTAKSNIRKLAVCAVFASLCALGAFIRIPLPPVPVTLQTFFCTLAGLLLGGRLAACSIGAYAALGLIGLPVFTQGGGIAYVLQPTFGYIIGFVAASFVTGMIAHRGKPTFARLLLAALCGLGIVYTAGCAYYLMIMRVYLERSVGISTVLVSCFLVFVPADIVFSLLAALIARRLIPVIERTGLLNRR